MSFGSARRRRGRCRVCAGPSVCGVVAPVGCGALAVVVGVWALWSLWAVLRRRLGVCRALWLVRWAAWRVRLGPPLLLPVLVLVLVLVLVE